MECLPNPLISDDIMVLPPPEDLPNIPDRIRIHAPALMAELTNQLVISVPAISTAKGRHPAISTLKNVIAMRMIPAVRNVMFISHSSDVSIL